jgi:hypothetical protein
MGKSLKRENSHALRFAKDSFKGLCSWVVSLRNMGVGNQDLRPDRWISIVCVR